MAKYGKPAQQTGNMALSPPTLFRVGEGAQLAGVCVGLETAGKGSALNWRLLFAVGSVFLWVPLIAYIVLAIVLPKYPTRKAALAATAKSLPEVKLDSSYIKEELNKIKQMREEELISEEEYKKLRSKTLGI